jgi:hypothetical protein
VWRKYVADDATEYAYLVDADHAAITARGWASVAAGTPPLPRGSIARRVFGRSASTGRPGTAVVGTTTCGLWTGVASTFTVEANDGTSDTCTVLERHPERIRLSR